MPHIVPMTKSSIWQWQSTGSSITSPILYDTAGGGCTGDISSLAITVTGYTTAGGSTAWTQWAVKNWQVQQNIAWERWTMEIAVQNQYQPLDMQHYRQAQADATQQFADRARERQEAHKVAVARARAMLDEGLTPAQRGELQQTGRYFTVYGGRTKRQYRVFVGKGPHGNIEEIAKDGSVVRRLCCAPTNVPEGDAVLGQKLFLEHAEEEFLRTANVTDVRTGAVMAGQRFVETGGLIA